MKIPSSADAIARGARARYFKGALIAYFALFAAFTFTARVSPESDNSPLLFVSAIIGAWTAIVLVWLFGDGRSDDAWLRAQIVIGIAIDLIFNGAARLASAHDYKNLAAMAISIGNLGILLAAIGIGLWVARGLLKPNYLVMASVVGALSDIFSVYAGPTKHLVGTQAFGFLAFAWPLVGSGGIQSIVGVGDFIFLALFFNGARRFDLDDRKTLLAMSAAIVAGFLSTLISPSGIPALPFFAVALLLAHGRELKSKMHES